MGEVLRGDAGLLPAAGPGKGPRLGGRCGGEHERPTEILYERQRHDTALEKMKFTVGSSEDDGETEKFADQKIFLLHHVPKGARQGLRWASLETGLFWQQSVCLLELRIFWVL